MRRHRLCTSSWVGPRRAPRPGQLRARRAACGPHRPRGPGHLKLLCRLPSRPVFPWPSEGSSKTSGLLSPPSLGAPGTPRPGWLPSASPCAGQAAPARSCLGILVPCTLPAPQPGPSHRARVPRRPPCPFHVPSTVPRGSSVTRVPKARKAPVLLVTGSGTERPLGGSDVCRPPHGRRTAPPPRPRSAARVGPGPGDAQRRGLPLRLRGSACRMPSPPSPLLPVATPRELRGRGLVPRPRRGFPGPFGRESSISVA